MPALALEATDGLRGPTDTWTARWENLADLVTRIAAQAGLGYRIVQAGTVLQFEVFTPADRSTTARFSRAAGTLRGYAYTLGAPNATTSVAGGQGTGSDRATAEVINAGAETDWGRVEAFVDSGGANPAALTQAATDNNTSNGPTATLSLSPIDTPTLRYGRDYALGDTVTVDVLTESLVDVVREVTLSTDATGMTVAPVVGNASSTGTDPAVNRAVRALAKRLNNLERSR